MKILTSVISGITLATLTMPVFADHNSKFGDNTGRTVAGVHDDRIDSNLKGSANLEAMGKNSAAVHSSGTLGGYAQSEYPDNVIPGLTEDYAKALTF